MSANLHTESRIDDPDDFYAQLIALHSGLSLDQSQTLNSKLVLLMANQIGDREVLDAILASVAKPH
jgi:hypothetical protein